MGYVPVPLNASILVDEQQIEIINNSGILERMKSCKSADPTLISDIRKLFKKLASNPNSLQFEIYNLVYGSISIDQVQSSNVTKMISNKNNPVIEFCYLIYQNPEIFVLNYRAISEDTLKKIDELYNKVKKSFYAREENFVNVYKDIKLEIIKELKGDLRILRYIEIKNGILHIPVTCTRLKEAYENEKTDFKKVYKKALDIFTFFQYVEYAYLPKYADQDEMFFNSLKLAVNATYADQQAECNALFPLRLGLPDIYMSLKTKGFRELALRCHVKENIVKLIAIVKRALDFHAKFARDTQLRAAFHETSALFSDGTEQLELVLKYLKALERLSDYDQKVYSELKYKY